ncbi:GNAT family N-acetyltransferase, partial [Fulvivirga kasyanovii]
MNVIINPSIRHLNDIEKWISQFKHHWDLIIQALKNKRLIVIAQGEETTGFLTYRVNGNIVNIDFLEVKMSMHKRGVGKKLVESSLEHFKKLGIRIAEILCRPQSSEIFWKKVGFTILPASTNFDPDELKLYRVLGKILPVSGNTIADREMLTLELWNEEPHLAKQYPSWRWQLICKTGSGSLVEPIVAPCHGDWKIRLIQGGETI